jgi:tRNA nucleotidyltransferase (CCA-adding enzyme)
LFLIFYFKHGNFVMKTFLVGGAVRDQLLNYPTAERDWVVVGATPQELLDQGFIQVGKDFPVFLHPVTKEEYALARIERKTAPGYAGFDFDTSAEVTLEQDLERRDLTINAMAQGDDGVLIDPYGGQQDIAHKKLRHVSKAFGEDPVRILRTARFAARYHHLGFGVADQTINLMETMVSAGEVDALVAERVWKETARALGERQPQVYFEILRECGALARIMPELDDLFGIPQPAVPHPEIDTGIHSLMSLQQAAALSNTLEVRFATLVHDLGKACTPSELLPKHHGHEQKGLAKIESLCARLGVPNSCKRLALVVSEYHTHCHRAFELKASSLNTLFSRLNAYRNDEFFNQFLLCCEADARGRTGFEARDYSQAHYLREALASCHGINAAPFIESGLIGPAVGQAITQERTRQLQLFKANFKVN